MRGKGTPDPNLTVRILRAILGATMPIHDMIVLGAGAWRGWDARRLAAAGADVLVVDRADKPGWSAARPAFSRASPPTTARLRPRGRSRFLSVLDTVDAERVNGWPLRVSGYGKPCQPVAFTPHQTRCAFVDGVNALPHSMARGLSLHLRAQAAAVEVTGDGGAVVLQDGGRLEARSLVFALALEQALPFLRTLPPVVRWQRRRGRMLGNVLGNSLPVTRCR